MKAISPMIAVVMLIAFTVAVGGIISVWLSTLATTQTTTVSAATDDQVRCSASTIAVKEVRYPSGIGSGNITVLIRYDSGTETLSNFTIDSIARGQRNTTTSPTRMDPGESRAINVTYAAYPPEIVSVRAFCRSKIAIIGDCQLGEPCMIGAG